MRAICLMNDLFDLSSFLFVRISLNKVTAKNKIIKIGKV
ncbi:hypothetical protein SC09_contig8orf00059 [Bacillus subtilis]|uniref:Uncharacterized protein n=1 Tax=Bacillus subtilis TaxID=1423 RepID=A0A0D1KDV3_BACIU|nr:hypothetical protein SC09_contig8orf00059 [Bacillus subtilis]